MNAFLALTLTLALAAAADPCAVVGLRDSAAERGLRFRHDAGRSPQKHLPETMGSGVAWLDYDGDGWMDLYVVQSGTFPPDGGPESADRLFRNRGDGRFGAPTFEDVTARAGIDVRGYGQGVVAADVDADGWTDLLILNFGSVVLLHNRGDGTFENATLDVEGWSSSAALADADGDGDLDLYVVRYVDYDLDEPLFCGDLDQGLRRYCDPSLFQGSRDVFLRQEEGRFHVDESVPVASGKGLGVLFVDLDGDFRPEIYVTNDITPNHLLHNRGGRLEDVSFLSGAAANREGMFEAGMGVAVGDVDRDGDPDLAVTNFDVETNTLYENLGFLQFEDVSAPSGYGVPSFNLLGFGLVLADLDLDGALDVYAANGHIFEQPHRRSVEYRQPDLLLLGDGEGGFREAGCSVLLEDPQLGRGLAAGDFDNDGDLDLAVANNDGPLQLRENTAGRMGNGWLALHGGGPGTVVTLSTVGGGMLRRWTTAGDSYQSSSDPRTFFGLGRDGVAAVEVAAPDGRSRRWVGAPVGRFLLIRR